MRRQLPPPLRHHYNHRLREERHPSPPLATVMKSCKTRRCLEQVHALIIQKGLHNDNYLISRLISVSTTTPTFSLLAYVTSIFSHVTSPNTCLWNSLLTAHCSSISSDNKSSLLSCLSVFDSMRVTHNVFPDKYTFPPLIKCCSSEFGFWVGVGIHGLSVKYGVVTDLYVGSSLVYFYGKWGVPSSARNVFDEMPVRNVVSWTALLVGYVNVGDVGNARKVFNEMPKRNQVSWNAMISGYVKAGELSSAREVFDAMELKNVVSYTTMVDGYAKCGDMVSARGLFEECVEKDVVLWSALISGYAQNGLPNEAVKCFRAMQTSRIRPDEFIMVSVMSACAQLGDLDLAKWIDSYMGKSSFDVSRVHVVAALVDMNVKCGNMDRAMCLFNNMPKRDLVSYCSMIQGLAIHGQGADAVKLFYDMLSEGITPDDVAFTVILTACSHAGMVDEGHCLFDMMRNKYSISPSPDHYACMVDLLGRFGHLEAAYGLLESMPIELHAGTWGALLGACRLHCNSELAQVVANRLVEFEPQNASNFVLLSNIYAAADRWLDVSLLRNQMLDRGLKKIRGCSWILGST